MSVVAFDYSLWAQQFPELAASVDETQAALYFATACDLVDNTPLSPIPYCPPQDLTRQRLLNLATAHVVKLFAPIGGKAPGGLVGRIESATQGSVSVTAKLADGISETAAFWSQTQYGLLYWTSSAGYRKGRYFATPRPAAGIIPYSLVPRPPWRR